MSKSIVVAGATGALGKLIVKALADRGVDVKALVRPSASEQKQIELQKVGAKVLLVDLKDKEQTAAACAGASCVISALAGLQDVIVETQSTLLDGAVAAGVARFIPSDFSCDFTKLTAGENRNFDLRRQFQEKLDNASIAPTSIFNGAFAEVLTYNIPLLNFKNKTIGYWQDADWKIDFTSMHDTAAYTAAAALDTATPRALHIASFQISARDLIAFTAATFGKPFELINMGSLEDLRAYNKIERAAHPEGEDELYPAWQQSQYMQSMFSVRNEKLDNDRYPDCQWSALKDIVKQVVSKN